MNFKAMSLLFLAVISLGADRPISKTWHIEVGHWTQLVGDPDTSHEYKEVWQANLLDDTNHIRMHAEGKGPQEAMRRLADLMDVLRPVKRHRHVQGVRHILTARVAQGSDGEGNLGYVLTFYDQEILDQKGDVHNGSQGKAVVLGSYFLNDDHGGPLTVWDLEQIEQMTHRLEAQVERENKEKD